MAFHEMMYQQRSAETEKGMKRRKREVGQGKKRVSKTRPKEFTDWLYQQGILIVRLAEM